MGFFKARNFAHSLKFALRGLLIAFRNERNLRVESAMGVFVLALSVILRVSIPELAIIILCITLVLFAEIVNTAIEGVVDVYFKDQYSRIAKNIKDISAGAVLVCSMGAAVIGIIILGSRFWALYPYLTF